MNLKPVIKGNEIILCYLEKYEIIEGEEKPIGLIFFSTGKNEEHIELIQLDKRN
ncbi:hypothetical protein BGP_2339 [Beggiatoa sp. PS]|nr:hypothetical protein BGP_2339 [Beggiatoa sp. PS]